MQTSVSGFDVTSVAVKRPEYYSALQVACLGTLLPPCAESAVRSSAAHLRSSGTGEPLSLTPEKGSKLIAVLLEASTIATGASALN